MAKRLLAIHIDGTIDYNEPIEVSVSFKSKLAELKRQGYSPAGIILADGNGKMTTVFGVGKTVFSNVMPIKTERKIPTIPVPVQVAGWDYIVDTTPTEVNF